MEVGIIADTHDRLPVIVKAVEFFEDESIRHLFHAGDFISPFAVRALLKFRGGIYTVFGNNDGERKGLKKLLPDIADDLLEVELEGKRILLAHRQEAVPKGKIAKCDVFIFGHTHKAQLSGSKPLMINPGEAGGWLYDVCTVAVLDLSKMKAKIVEI